MIETFVVALGSLIVVLYVQARLSAREIRRNRAESAPRQRHLLLSKRRI